MEGVKYQIDDEEGIDLRKWFFRIIDHWPIFISFVIPAIFLAFLYNTFTGREYKLSTSILVKDNSNPLDKSDIVRVSFYSDPYRLDNEIGIINSSSLKKQTLKQLDFIIEYFRNSHFQQAELYSNCPFRIIPDTLHKQPVNVEFKVRFLSDSTLLMQSSGTEIPLYNFKFWQQNGLLPEMEFTDTFKLGDTVINDYLSFVISADFNGYSDDYKDFEYSFYFRDLAYLLGRFGEITVNIPNGSSIMNIAFTHSNPEKAALYLNKLVDNYLNKGIERENLIAQRTIDFIDFQLTTLVDSLNLSEQMLEDFRSDKRLVSIDIQAQQAYSRQNELESRKAELVVQKKYLEYLKQNLSDKQASLDELIAPSTLDINDAVLNNMVQELVSLYSERTELTLNTKKNNPFISSLDLKIESVKQKLYQTVINILDATEISLEGVNNQTGDVFDKLSKLPRDQRELLNFQRKFELNDELYTYLLTRRSEMQIQLASNVPSNEVLETATPSDAVITHPDKRINYIIALILGLMVPFGIVYVKTLLNNKVLSPEDVKTISDIPLIGTIFNDEEIISPAVVHSPLSVVAESLRMLRANLQFITGDTKSPVFIVSSAMKGEGKSFVSLNTAAVYATYGKKVCLVDLDLRRPRLSEYLGIKNQTGISNCLIGQATVKEIMCQVSNNLFCFIPSGPIPPNPSELIASQRLANVINDLKSEFDIIILDTPPIGMVSDALFLSHISDYFLLVVRHKVTYKQLLGELIDDMKRNQIKGISIVLNDMPPGRKGYYRYGSKYGYYYKSDKKNA